MEIHILSRAVIIDNGYILLSRPAHPAHNRLYYFLPGGHLEKGESISQALIRELDEETTFQFTIDRFLGCFEYSFIPKQGTPKCHNHEYNFIFLAHSTIMKAGMLPADPKLAAELEWVPYDSLQKIQFYPQKVALLIPQLLSCDFDQAFQSSMSF